MEDKIKEEISLLKGEINEKFIDLTNKFNTQLSNLKTELTELISDMGDLLTADLNALRIELTKKINDLDASISGKIANITNRLVTVEKKQQHWKLQ